MNTTLIMNASEGRIQFVLEQEGSLACAQEWSAPSKGTELLTPALADAFQRLGIMPSDISRIACVAGPGSFTGLRLALTTAAAFRRATGAAVAPLNALQALAGSVPFGLLFPARETRIRVITHARRGLVHGQDFLCAPGSALPSPVDEPAMWEIPAACGGERPDIMLGSGVARNLPQLEGLFGDSAPLFLPALTHPTAQALLDLTLALPDGSWGSISAPATPWTISPPSPPSVVRLPKRPMPSSTNSWALPPRKSYGEADEDWEVARQESLSGNKQRRKERLIGQHQ